MAWTGRKIRIDGASGFTQTGSCTTRFTPVPITDDLSLRIEYGRRNQSPYFDLMFKDCTSF